MFAQIIFDVIIFGFLTADGLLIFFLLRRRTRVRRRHKGRAAILRGFVVTCALISWGVIFYGSFVEPFRVSIVEKTIELSPSGTDSLRVVVMGDFHVGPYKKSRFVRRAVSMANSLQPDLIVLLGDFISTDVDEVRYLQPLKTLSAPLGVFAVLGNHDYGNDIWLLKDKAQQQGRIVSETLTLLGIRVLMNDGAILKTGAGKNVALTGVDEVWTHRASIERALKALNASEIPHPLIVLAHNPDIIYSAADSKVDFVIAAHTHGGQVRLPIIGPVVRPPTSLGRAYDEGLFTFGDTQLYITSGLGETGTRARLFNPPEIGLLTLRF